MKKFTEEEQRTYHMLKGRAAYARAHEWLAAHQKRRRKMNKEQWNACYANEIENLQDILGYDRAIATRELDDILSHDPDYLDNLDHSLDGTYISY